jgi:hypothetical protein
VRTTNPALLWEEQIVKLSKGGLIFCGVYTALFLLLVWQSCFGEAKNQAAATLSAIRMVTWSLGLLGPIFGSEDFWRKNAFFFFPLSLIIIYFFFGPMLSAILEFMKPPASTGDQPPDTQ